MSHPIDGPTASLSKLSLKAHAQQTLQTARIKVRKIRNKKRAYATHKGRGFPSTLWAYQPDFVSRCMCCFYVRPNNSHSGPRPF
jgi:hypothetical protein